MIKLEQDIKDDGFAFESFNLLRQMREELHELSQTVASLKTMIADISSIKTHINDQNPLFLKNQLDVQGVIQKNLISSWLLLKQNNLAIQDLNQIEFRVFSQNNEDGLLLYLFTMIGTTNKLFVEIGANTDDSSIGIPENNTTNLVVYHSWNGLIIDANPTSVNELIYFFAKCKNTKHYHWQERKSKREDESNYISPMVKSKFITSENINAYLTENKIPAEIDLLSIDIDGMDYHVWEAITVTSPRVVLIEFNQRMNVFESHIPPNILNSEEITSPSEETNRLSGCSLKALILLAKKKKYRLIAITSSGFNAIFLRNDIGKELFQELTEEQFQNIPLWHWTEKSDFYSTDIEEISDHG